MTCTLNKGYELIIIMNENNTVVYDILWNSLQYFNWYKPTVSQQKVYNSLIEWREEKYEWFNFFEN